MSRADAARHPTFFEALVGTLRRDPPSRWIVVAFAVLTPTLFTVRRFGGLFFTVFAGLVALVVVAALWRLHGLPQRYCRFWRQLAAAFACMAAGTLVFAATAATQQLLLLKELPAPLAAASTLLNNLLFSAYYLLIILALERRPHRLSKEPLTVSQRALTWPLWLVSSLGIVTYLVAIPVLMDPEGFQESRPFVVYYLLLQSYLATRLFYFFRAMGTLRWRWLYGVLALAQGSFFLGCGFEILQQKGILALPAAASDAWVVLFLFLVAVAARLRHFPLPFHEETYDSGAGARREPLTRARILAHAFAFPLMHFALYTLWIDGDSSKPYRDTTVAASVLALVLIAALERRRQIKNQRSEDLDESWLAARGDADLRLMVERAHADEILYGAGGRFTQIFRSCPELVALHSLEDGRFLEVSPAYQSSLGYTRYDLVGRSGEEAALWASEKDAAELRRRLAESGRVRGLVAEWRDKGGEAQQVVLSAAVVEIEARLLFVSMARRLGPSRRRRTAFFDRVRDAVTIVDLQGRITYWNPGAEQLYGWSAMEAVGRFADGLLAAAPAAGAPAAAGSGAGDIAGEGPFVRELTQLTRGGESLRVTSWSTLLCDTAGRPRSRLVVTAARSGP